MRLFILHLLLLGALGAQTKPLALTQAEQRWIKDHPVVRWGYDGKYEPYAIVNPDGTVAGIDADYLKLISSRTGLTFEPHTSGTWSAVMGEFREGKLDLLSSLGHAPGREQYLTYSLGYAYSPDAIVTRDDAPIVFDISNLEGQTVAVPLGFVGIQQAIETGAPKAKVIFYPSMLECYKAVSHGQVFAAFSDLPNAAFQIQTQGLSNLRLGVIVSDTAENYFGIRKDLPELVSIMNKALQSITVEERKAISNKWISVSVTHDPRWQTAARVLGVLLAVLAVVALAYGYRHHMLRVALRASAESQQRLEAANAELQQAQSELAQANQAKTDLMRMVAHDLRSPLTGLMMQADLLKLDAQGEEEKFAAELIHTSVARMARMVEDLMDAHALEGGQMRVTPIRTNVQEAIQASILTFSGVAAQKHIAIAYHGPSTPVWALTDPSAYRRVVENLLTNALKYSPPRSQISVLLEALGDSLSVRIHDSGPGVPQEERRRIFEKYSTGAAKPTKGERSTGLGLWIVTQLSEALQGKVEVLDHAQGGAVFVFSIPRGQA